MLRGNDEEDEDRMSFAESIKIQERLETIEWAIERLKNYDEAQNAVNEVVKIRICDIEERIKELEKRESSI